MARHTSARLLSPARLKLTAAAAVLAVAPAAFGQVAPTPAVPPPPPAAAPAAAPVPQSVTDIQQLIDAKDYAGAVKAAAKLLGQHGPATAGVSRFQVTMLKGDAQAGAKQMAAARAVYLSAVRETRDPHEKALATWTAELFRRAKGTNYVPHQTGAGNGANNGTPIDLIDRDSRKLAFAALLDDELSVLGPKVKTASRTASLVPILPVVQQVQSLAELDQVANGTEDRTDAVAGPLVEHARTLMASALKGMWTRISDIHTSATALTTNTVGTVIVNGFPTQQTTQTQNGLTANDQSELRGMIDTCNKIKDAAETFMPLSAAGGTAAKDWGAVQNDAVRVAGRAHDVLFANYSGSVVSDTGDGSNGGYNNGGGYGTGTNGYYPGGYNAGGLTTTTTGGYGTGTTAGTNTGGTTVTGGTTTGGTPTGTPATGTPTPATPPATGTPVTGNPPQAPPPNINNPPVKRSPGTGRPRGTPTPGIPTR